MPESQARTHSWIKRSLLMFGLLVLVIVGAILLVRFLPQRASSVPLLLPDGSTVSVAGVTCGTNHVFGSWLARFAMRAPLWTQDLLVECFGSRATVAQHFTTPTPTLVVWLDSTKAPPLPTMQPGGGWFEAFLADTNGFVSGVGINFNPGTGSVLPMKYSVFPRRDRNLALHFYFHDPQGVTKDCGSLKLSNPGAHSFPQWQAETLPVTRRAGDVETTLERVVTGVGNRTTTRVLPGGGFETEYGNRTDGRNETAGRIRLRSLTDTNQEWQLANVELGDATGNVLMKQGMSWNAGGGDFSFSPGLWTDESAWKLRCEIKRAKGFGPDELFTFHNVPLGQMFQTNQLGWTTNFSGVIVTLMHFVRRPPITNSYWSSAQLSQAGFSVTGLLNDLHVDLLETRADNGTNVECASWSNDGINQERTFPNVPAEAKSLDFTFAVHQGRWVEFLVKPETGQTRFVEPAKRGEK